MRFPSVVCRALLIGFLFLTTLTPSRAWPEPPALLSSPPYLTDAESLLPLLREAKLNVYGGGHRLLKWDANDCEARTVCSSFVTLLLEHTYHQNDVDIRRWLGKGDPDAADYYEAIAARNGFRKLSKISSLKPGDFIAIEYHDDSKDTGHVMLICEAPTVHPASAPLVGGTTQYDVTVIDSSASGHGPDDTREKNGRLTGGIGQGVFRLYADADGKLVGYAWSNSAKSTYYRAPARLLTAGRLTRDLAKP